MIVPYSATPGPTSPAVTAAGSTLPSSLDLFCCFFTREVWELLVMDVMRAARLEMYWENTHPVTNKPS